MANNLRARLQRIRESAPLRADGDRASPGADTPGSEAPGNAATASRPDPAAPALPGPDWTPLSPLVAKRSLAMGLPPLPVPAALPQSLGILVPDLLRYPAAQGRFPPRREDLLFFDLETTGLSAGPGTLAFLAAFGRLSDDGLRVDQYLLLDYPGEADFLEAALGEFAASGNPPLVVSYNGKSFDTQLLRIRCLMNGIHPPEYAQVDLLHPCRRLWKRSLPSCSQGAIETAVLGLGREGDMPGAMAPDIWFAYLKNNEPSDLLKVCDHNARDIFGLAAILGALCAVADDPQGAGEGLRCDPESLALWWRRETRVHGEGAFGLGTAQTGEKLLRAAAEEGHRRAAFSYYRALAIEAEWKKHDPELALGYAGLFLALPAIQDSMEDEMLHRRERLLEKTKQKEANREYTAFGD